MYPGVELASERHSNHTGFSHLRVACLLSVTVSSFHRLLRILCEKHYYILIRKQMYNSCPLTRIIISAYQLLVCLDKSRLVLSKKIKENFIAR